MRPKLTISLLLLILALTLFLRVYRLTDVPSGLHGDEAVFGIDARRILHEGYIGPFSPLALGQPTGPMYLAALSVWRFGNTIFAVRLVSALMGTLTVMLLFVVARRSYGDRAALWSAALLAVQGWHLHYSRIGFPIASWPFSVLLFAGVLTEALRRDETDHRAWAWWAAAGGTLAAGIYVYNAHLWLVAVGTALAGVALLWQRALKWRQQAVRGALFGFALLVIALPLLMFAVKPQNGYFNHFHSVSVSQMSIWQTQGIGAKLFWLGRQYLLFWARLASPLKIDFVDGSGITAMLSPLMLLLVVSGMGVVVTRRQRALGLIGMALVFLTPVGGLFTDDGHGFTRRSFAMAPLLALFAGIALDETLAFVLRRRQRFFRWGGVSGLAALTGFLIYQTLWNYFGVFAADGTQRWIFCRALTDASAFMLTLPPDAAIYFYSARWSVNYDTRQFLAPTIHAQDRSRQFGRADDPPLPAETLTAYLFLDEYLPEADLMPQRHPGGTLIAGGSDPANPTFRAYLLPLGK